MRPRYRQLLDDGRASYRVGSRGARARDGEGQKPDKAPYRLLAAAANAPSRCGVGEAHNNERRRFEATRLHPRGSRGTAVARAHCRSPFRARCQQTCRGAGGGSDRSRDELSAARPLPARTAAHLLVRECKGRDARPSRVPPAVESRDDRRHSRGGSRWREPCRA